MEGVDPIVTRDATNMAEVGEALTKAGEAASESVRNLTNALESIGGRRVAGSGRRTRYVVDKSKRKVAAEQARHDNMHIPDVREQFRILKEQRRLNPDFQNVLTDEGEWI